MFPRVRDIGQSAAWQWGSREINFPFSKRKNGMWVEEGHDRRNGSSLTIGERDEYNDPSF